MKDFWRRYLCRMGIHWWQYVDSGYFRGHPFSYIRERCKFCGKEGFTPQPP